MGKVEIALEDNPRNTDSYSPMRVSSIFFNYEYQFTEQDHKSHFFLFTQKNTKLT